MSRLALHTSVAFALALTACSGRDGNTSATAETNIALICLSNPEWLKLRRATSLS